MTAESEAPMVELARAVATALPRLADRCTAAAPATPTEWGPSKPEPWTRKRDAAAHLGVGVRAIGRWHADELA